MAAEPKLYQGEDKTIIVKTNIPLTSATEIEFIIDTPTQIKKTLSDVQITDVTATQYTVQIDAGDTETVDAGEYKYQTRATIDGKITNGRFQPNKINILNSAFTTGGSNRDYN
jgi:hypothetical protein